MTAREYKPGFRAVVAALATVAAIILAWFNVRQHREFQPPYDGVTWQDTSEGVVALAVDSNGPGSRAFIHPGDRLTQIKGIDIPVATRVARVLDDIHAWHAADYTMSREGQPFTTQVILEQEPPNLLLRYRWVVGILYLGIGLFVVLRRPNAPRSALFYLFCLVSFALYFYSYTGKFNLFDWSIYWLNGVALLFQPPMFLHFALVFPERKPLLDRYRMALPVIYTPALVLLGLSIALSIHFVEVRIPAATLRWLLDRVILLHLGVFHIAAAAVLYHTYRTSDSLVQRQLKWVTRGTTLAIALFTGLYVIPFFLGVVLPPVFNFSLLGMALIPLTFGYAIFRWRLMEVDILVRRTIGYTLATAALVGGYFTLAALAGAALQKVLPHAGTWGWVVAVVATAFLFQPLRNWIQERLDRFFYQEGYDYRRTMVEFGRELSADVDLHRMLSRVLERLSQTLSVDAVAIFLANDDSEGDAGAVRLERSLGIITRGHLDLSFLDPQRPELQRGVLFFENVHQAVTESASAQQAIAELDLHYYMSCVAQGHTVAFLGLGKTREGDFLSTEDVALLQTLSGYLGTAIENARLYRRLERKVEQYERVKDYSENIVESVNVGILALDLDDRIESWNTQVELMYGITRDRAIGCKMDEVFPADLVAELVRMRGSENPTGIHNLYKYRVRTSAGTERVFNVAVAPLVSKKLEMVGRLVIFDDITERMDLERQLTQTDKLSSIGLLAAGVAHEVNTPLAVISSYAQMLAKQMPDDDPRWKLLDRINRSSFRASEIVNNLLNFSRTGSAEFANLDLNQVIWETLALLDHQFRTGRVQVERRADDKAMVSGNSGKLQQVFLNLFLNAREAMPEGGTLVIATETEGGRARVIVSDTGQGIDPKHINRIYDPFFTTKQARDKGRGKAGELFRGGTGLGLSVSYGIVQEHGGSIQVESAPSRGTTFVLEFPLVQARESALVSGD